MPFHGCKNFSATHLLHREGTHPERMRVHRQIVVVSSFVIRNCFVIEHSISTTN
jgi:hypothetical protein